MPVIGSAGLVFGMTDQTFGLAESFTLTKTCQTAKAANGAGAIKGVSFYGPEETLDFTYLFLTATGAPTAQVGTGTAFTFADARIGGDWRVIESSESGSGTEFGKIQVKCERYPDLGT